MTYIEDYMKEFAFSKIRTSKFDSQISSSLALQILTSNKALTEKQGNLALRLLDKYKSQFVAAGFTDIIVDLKNPKFKQPFRIVDMTKTVDIVDNEIVIKFPFDQSLVTSMREISNVSIFCKPVFDGDIKAWKMSLNEESLTFVEGLISKDFELSKEVKELVSQMTLIRANMEDHIPMLCKFDKKYKIKNCLINEEYDDLESAIIGSVSAGIYVHDDQVHQDLMKAIEKEPLLKLFTIANLQKVLVTKEEYSKQELLSLVKKFNTTVAIFFEDDAKSQDLTEWYNTLLSVGVNNSEIGVYFRKSGASDFNQTIKDLGLNKDADDPNVKWVILSSKYPKSLFKNDKTAEICIFVDRHVTTHYTTINVMNNSLLNIRYAERKVAEFENAYNMRRGDKIVVL
jgi:hypothetical protein